MSLELMNSAVVDRERRNKEICKMYLRLTKTYPKVAPSKIMSEIARRVDLTPQMILKILTKAEVYKPKN
jgi:hypothetical protein